MFVSCTALETTTLSGCVSVSGNNPFLINNIINGTSYNISVSLMNDFGESGHITALYGECINNVCYRNVVYVRKVSWTLPLSSSDLVV